MEYVAFMYIYLFQATEIPKFKSGSVLIPSRRSL